MHRFSSMVELKFCHPSFIMDFMVIILNEQ